MQTTIFVLVCAITFVQFPTYSFADVNTAAVQSHSVVSNTENSLKGTIVVSNCDKDSLSQSKAALSNQLTQKIQADTNNSNSKVQVKEIRELSNGTLALDYECNHVSDHETAKKSLYLAVRQDDIKKTIHQSSKNDTSHNLKSKQQPTSKTQPTPKTGQSGDGLPKKPSKNGHKISSKGDNVDVLIVKKCARKLVAKNVSNPQSVVEQLSLLVNRQLVENDIKELYNVEFVEAIDYKTHTLFHYSINAKKQYHDKIKAALLAISEDEQLRNKIDQLQSRLCSAHSSLSDSYDSNENKDFDRIFGRSNRGSQSNLLNFLSSTSLGKGKSQSRQKIHVNKLQINDITRILSSSGDVPFKRGDNLDSPCSRCGSNKISSALLLDVATVKEISNRVCGRFRQIFKYILAAEIRKYQRIGLKSVDITNILIDKKQNLIIEFDLIIDPQYKELILYALRDAVITLDLQRAFKHRQCH